MKLLKYINFLKILIKIKFHWSLPNKKKFVIYDNNSIEYFFKYLDKRNTYVLHTRGESLCLPILFKTIFKNGLNQIILNYFANYINFINPKILITMTDNDLRFYMLKKRLYQSITTISVQNGMIGSRNFFENFYKYKKKNKSYFACDYILCANDKLKNKYKKIIKSKVISIGSFKSNSIEVKKVKFSNYILFLSQFNPPKKNTNETFFKNKNYLISHKSYYEDDIKILKNLINICENKKLKLYIKLRHQYSAKEKKFYMDNVNLNNTKFLSSTNTKNNYQIIDKAKIVVFVDSFMGYEAFGRGKKILAFPIRGKTLKLKNANFADDELKKIGIFWSNKCNSQIFNKLFNNLITMKNNNWIKLRKKYESNIMLYEKNNTTFKKLIT